MNFTRKIILSGAPASGKGTVSERIVDKYRVVHVSTGDLLRIAVADQTPLGKEAHTYMITGKLVPDKLVVSLVKEKLETQEVRKCGWLLDGFPRTQAQAVALKNLGINPTHVVLLDVPESVLIDRAVGRRLDPVTGKIYHIKTNPPPSPVIAKRLVQRDDDTEIKMRNRLLQYNTNLSALIDSYRNILVTVNGDQHPNKVFEEVDRYLSLGPSGNSPLQQLRSSPLPPGRSIVENRFVIHLRCKQISRTNTQLCTLVYGFEEGVDLQALLETFKLAFHCGGRIEKDELFGRHILLLPTKGDIKDEVKDFIVEQGYAKKDQVTLHVSLL